MAIQFDETNDPDVFHLAFGHLDELTRDFDIFGIYPEDSGVIYELYEKQKPYAYFAVQRKSYNLNR